MLRLIRLFGVLSLLCGVGLLLSWWAWGVGQWWFAPLPPLLFVLLYLAFGVLLIRFYPKTFSKLMHQMTEE